MNDEKNLPIKVIEKRRRDSQRTEGGGGNKPPKWQLEGDALSHHAQELEGSVAQLAAAFKAHQQEQSELPMVMVTTISDEAIAKSHRGEIVSLLNSDNRSNVIGMEATMPPQTESAAAATKKSGSEPEMHETRMVLSLVTTDELLSNIRKKLQDTEGSAKLISSITGMGLFEPRIGDYNPDNKAYIVALLDYQDADRNARVQQLFRNQCSSNGITIAHETRYSSDMHLFRITLDSAEELELVRNFGGIRYIEETLPIAITTDYLEEEALPAIKSPKEGELYPVVGVLDSGIQRNPYLAPWVLDEGIEYYGEELQDKSHGSMVASVVEYSDELNGTAYASTDGVMLFEAIVIPDRNKEKVYPGDVLDNIRDAIQRHPEIRIWTMSIGTDEESALDVFSEYGKTLDNIADENGVLIIKSAGNSGAFKYHLPMPRIAKMADSVRALVVGSIAGEKGQYDMAEVYEASPFSRCGPGPQYVIKPDLVAYGGNAGIKPDGRLTITGIKTINMNGGPGSEVGTSFSTPWVARIAADLSFHLDGEFDPLLIKALIIHSASYPIGHKMSMDDKKKFMGFGMPHAVKDILYNDDYEITLVLRDSLEKGSFINIMDFPFPASLVGEDGLFRGQIKLTMVSSPRLFPSQGPEYCQSDIGVAFGTMDGIKERDTSKPTIINPYGPDDGHNILSDSLYSAQVFNVLEDTLLPLEPFARERTLLRHGKKYRPIKKYAVDLSEMTAANRQKCLGSSRQWYLRVDSLFREAIEREASITGEILQQEFCIILTIRDPLRKAPVYTEVTQQLQQKGFIYSNVALRNEVREHVRVEEEHRG